MKYLLRIITQKNRNVPFGSIVTIKGNNSIAGIVGDNGEVFLTGLSESGTLLVKWGRDMKSSCSVSFTNISKTDTHPLVCR
ncbi:TPA: FimD/PapC C-terminal domain-containing protein [Escherichia coli]